MNTLLRFYGGKSHLVKKLLEFIPPHRKYVEVFGGAAHLLFSKPPSLIEIYNDINRYLVDFFRVLQDEENYKRLIWRLRWTLYSREEYLRARKIFLEGGGVDDVERAWAFFICARQSFAGGLKTGWSFDMRTPRYNSGSYYNLTWDETEFKRIRERLRLVYVECRDWRRVIETHDAEDTFFFLDPPYPPSTLRCKDTYIHNLTEEEHAELAETLKGVEGMFMLTTYRTDYYDAMGVNHVDIMYPLHPAKNRVKERVALRMYFNYDRPVSSLMNFV